MVRRLRVLDGRVLAGALVAVFFVTLSAVSIGGRATPWRSVGVNAVGTKFEDMASITSSWDCERRGIQAFPDNPCDPQGRPANYPRLWTQLSWAGLGSGDTTALGVTVAVVFFLAALIIPGPLGAGEGLVYAAALLAPATLLGVERGNVDLLMFALIALAVAVIRRSPLLAAAAITLAGVLKLFPALALATLVRSRRRWRAAAAAVVVLAAYAALTLHDIRTLEHVIPRVVGNSYGAGVIADALHQANVGWARSGAEVRAIRLGVIALGLVAAAGLLALQRRTEPEQDDRRLEAFWAGTAVYAGTYVFGNNFDYRLVFLLLCVPQLCAWIRSRSSPVPGATAALVALLVTLWLSSSYPPLPFGLQTWYVGFSFPPEEVLNWLLFAWLLAALAATSRARPLLRRSSGVA